MIERYFSQTKVLIRLQSGPVGPYLPGFVSALEESRFSRDSIRRLIRGADRLCRWLDGQGVERRSDNVRLSHQGMRFLIRKDEARAVLQEYYSA